MKLNHGWSTICTHDSFNPQWKTPYKNGYWEIKSDTHEHICSGHYNEYNKNKVLEMAELLLEFLRISS